MDHHRTLKRSLVRTLFQAPVHDYNLHFFNHAIATKPLHHPTLNSGVTHNSASLISLIWNTETSEMTALLRDHRRWEGATTTAPIHPSLLSQESEVCPGRHGNPGRSSQISVSPYCWDDVLMMKTILLLTQITVGTVYSFQHERSCHL